MSKPRGIIAAILAYTAWGPLAPLGALLLQSTGPFTLNVVRTAGSLVLFAIVLGPRVVARSFRILTKDLRVWILGVLGLGFTFGAYLGSILYLEPTIAALTIYLSPILVSWIAHARMGEQRSPLFLPTIALTLLGGAMAVLEPSRGLRLGAGVGWGLFLGLLGVLGWTFYTLYLKHLGSHYSDAELTVTAFLTSGVAFLFVAIPFEGLRFHVTQASLVQLAVYIVFPSFASFQLYAIAVRQAGATLTSVLLGIELVATAIFSLFLTDEAFHFEKLVGIALVLVAVTAFLVAEASSATTNEPRASEGP